MSCGSSITRSLTSYIPVMMMMMMNTVIFLDGHIGIFRLKDLSFLYDGI